MLPFMVSYYYPDLDVKEYGYRAGLLGSAFSTGSLFGNFIWGVASDRIGRKPALILGLWGSVIASLVFAFSKSFWVIVFARFLWGLLNGNIGVSKTYVAEILDDSNMAKGMALYGTIGGVGRTLGPILGGYLMFPARSATWLQDTVFDEYPFALPATTVSAMCLVTSLLSLKYLPETLPGSWLYISPEDSAPKAGAEVNVVLRDTVYSPLNAMDIDSEERENLAREDGCQAQLALRAQESQKGSEQKAFVADVANSSARSGDALEEIDLHTSDVESGVPQQRSPEILPCVGTPAARLTPTPVGGTPSSAVNTPKRSVGFANVVMVKTIGSNAMAYGPLKRVNMEDVPIPIESSPTRTTRAVANEQVEQEEQDFEDVNAPMWPALRERASAKSQTYAGNSDGDELEMTTPVRAVASSTSTDTSTDEPDMSPVPMSTSPSVAAPRTQLRFSNGSEFFDGAGRGGVHSPSEGLWAQVSYLLTRKQIFISTLMYGLVGFFGVMMIEIFPLWVVTRVTDGGFDYKEHDIGWIMTVSGPVSILGQVLFYPSLVEKFGLIKTYVWAGQTFAITAILTPCISLVSQYKLFSQILLTLAMAVMSTVQMWIFISIFTFINNSCYSHQRSTVNGIGQTFAALGRLTAPAIGANLFAWSENNGLTWPLNYALCWYVVAGMAIIGTHLVYNLPKSIIRRKREPRNALYTAQSRSDTS